MTGVTVSTSSKTIRSAIRAELDGTYHGTRRLIATTQPTVGPSRYKKKNFLGAVLLAFFVPAFIYFAQSIYQNLVKPTPLLNPSISISPNHKVLGIEVQTEQKSIPIKLKIPSIKVDAPIESLGITLNGTMATPSNVADVAWFNLGSRPGEIGSTVIAGHLDSQNGQAGVFGQLDKLKLSEKVYIEDNLGKSLTFMVWKIGIYNAGFADEVFSRNDGSYLNLVTCDGTWDQTQKSYSKRLVVFTKLIP